jgi:hypothetical protein
VAALLVTGSALAGGTASGAHACVGGVRKVGAIQERTFCGPATASVVADKVFTISQGNCVSTSKYFSLNIGSLYLGQTAKKKPNYFGLDVGRLPGSTAPPAGKDGVYTTGVVLAVEYGGKSYLVLKSLKATLSGNRTQGMVSGKTITGQLFTATFQC